METVDEADRKRRARCFVSHFSKSFIQKIDPEYQRKVNEKGLTNAILGGILGKFAKIFSEAVDLANNAAQRKKAKTAEELLENCIRETLYEILVKGGKEVFKSFEEALTKLSLHDLKKTAEDASARVLDYMISHRSELSVETIWKGVLEGSSEKNILAKFSLSIFGSKGRTVHSEENNPENISKAKNQKGKLARITSGALTKISTKISKKISNNPKEIAEKSTVDINTSDIFLYSEVLILSDEFPYDWNIYSKDQCQFDYLPYRLSCEGENVNYLKSIGYQLKPTNSSSQHEDSYHDHRLTEEIWSNIIPTIVAELCHGKETSIIKLITDVGNGLNIIHDKIDRIAEAGHVFSDVSKQNSFLPFPLPDKNYTGREDLRSYVLKLLFPSQNVEQELQVDRLAFPVVCLYGLGGHGKSQTAMKIASICNFERPKRAEFIWVEAETEEDIRLKLIRELKNQMVKHEHSDDLLLLVNELFLLLKSRKNERFVVVFDNITQNLAKKYLPLDMPLENVSIILTSAEQVKIVHPIITVDNILIDTLQQSEAKDLVKKILKGNDEEDDLLQLVEESGYIPVILCLMATNIAVKRNHRSDYSIKEYLSTLNGMQDQILQYPSVSHEMDHLNLSYKKSLFACVKFNVQSLKESRSVYAKLAYHLFESSAYFPPDQIPYYYFSIHSKIIKEIIKEFQSEHPFSSLNCNELVKEGFNILSTFSLVAYGQSVNNISMHRMHRFVQIVSRIILNKDEERIIDNISMYRMHRLVQRVSRIILNSDEERIIDNILQDMPCDTMFYEASIWSHACKHKNLVEKHKSKLSFERLASSGLWTEIEQILEQINEGVFIKKMLMQFPVKETLRKRNALVIALENNRQSAYRIIEKLKINENNFDETYSEEDWNEDMFTTLTLLEFSDLKLLLNKFHFDVNYQRKDDKDTLLNNAIRCQSWKKANYLFFEKKAKPTKFEGDTTLHLIAGVYNRSLILSKLLANGIISENDNCLNDRNDEGRYPFMLCVENVIGLRFFLDKDCSNVNAIDSSGCTALQLAMESFENMSSIKVLMKYSNINFLNEKTGQNAWHSAMTAFCQKRHTILELLQLLKDQNVDETVKDKQGNSYLHHLMTISSFKNLKSAMVRHLMEFLSKNNLLGVIDEDNNNGENVVTLAKRLRDQHKDDLFYMHWNYEVIIHFLTNPNEILNEPSFDAPINLMSYIFVKLLNYEE